MKPKNLPEEEPRLREVLTAWKVDATLPPRFQERVWQRLERRTAQSPASAWAQLVNEIGLALARPRLAVSYVTALLAVGLLAGFWQAQSAKARAGENLSARYVQLLDPYQMPRP
jgi:hypothetical protein